MHHGPLELLAQDLPYAFESGIHTLHLAALWPQLGLQLIQNLLQLLHATPAWQRPWLLIRLHRGHGHAARVAPTGGKGFGVGFRYSTSPILVAQLPCRGSRCRYAAPTTNRASRLLSATRTANLKGPTLLGHSLQMSWHLAGYSSLYHCYTSEEW